MQDPLLLAEQEVAGEKATYNAVLLCIMMALLYADQVRASSLHAAWQSRIASALQQRGARKLPSALCSVLLRVRPDALPGRPEACVKEDEAFGASCCAWRDR